MCRAPGQFSCWNADDPNYSKLLAVTTKDSPEFAIAVALSLKAVGRKLPDATGNADSYYALTMKQMCIRDSLHRNRISVPRSPTADVLARLVRWTSTATHRSRRLLSAPR